VLRDYIEENRIDVTDESGRKPLLTTKVGRIARNTIRKWSYRLTRPCWYPGECPHGRELSECRASVGRVSRETITTATSVQVPSQRTLREEVQSHTSLEKICPKPSFPIEQTYRQMSSTGITTSERRKRRWSKRRGSTLFELKYSSIDCTLRRVS